MQEGETDEYKIKYANNVHYHTFSCLSPPITFPPTTKKKKRPNLNPNHSEDQQQSNVQTLNSIATWACMHITKSVGWHSILLGGFAEGIGVHGGPSLREVELKGGGAGPYFKSKVGLGLFKTCFGWTRPV